MTVLATGVCNSLRISGGHDASLTAVKVDNQPIKRFTHKPTHIKAKFVRISIYEINGYRTRLK